ncbi:MAG TPA: class I SAM-dependent methyltransferase [Rectinemataceae bacterium]|nr:class I SAM-dependent methyltransferase [Rectinemataceae bacterium]
MKSGEEWFEDESFWTAYAPLMFDEGRWAEVPAVIDSIEALAKPVAGGAVLDACCGPGRHSLELASRGYRVTGIDITRAYLEAARESAAAWAVDAEFLRADLREFVRPGAFDLALNLYTSFGYFADPGDDLTALQNLHDCLAPGGALVLETLGKEVAAKDFVEGEWFERGEWMVLTQYEVVGAWEGLRNRWIMIPRELAAPPSEGRPAANEDPRGHAAADRSFVLRLYSGSELRDALFASGFRQVEIYGSLAGGPYDQTAKSLVAVARS